MIFLTCCINKLPCCEVFHWTVGSPEPVPGKQCSQEGRGMEHEGGQRIESRGIDLLKVVVSTVPKASQV